MSHLLTPRGRAAAGPRVFVHRFDVPGTFGYHCTPHGGPGTGQSGTVIVTAA